MTARTNFIPEVDSQRVTHAATNPDGTEQVRLDAISYTYGTTPIIKDLSLSINKGELVCLLGPSGCGKTTTLNIIAGFMRPQDGCLEIDGKDMTDVPAHKRGLGMVFQEHALFPHLTIYENVAFGLRRQNQYSKSDIDTRVKEVLDAVQLKHTLNRYPAALSGGQQQRIGLARALAIRPRVLLMDEPLSNLDAKLRREMQTEIRRIHDEYQLTTVYVTHDQEEAMVLGDRVVVMREGEIEQLGAPQEIYVNPKTEFVARFVGERNIVTGTVDAVHDSTAVLQVGEGRNGRLIIPNGTKTLRTGDTVTIAIREELVELSATKLPAAENTIPVTLRHIGYRGGRIQCMLESPLGSLRAQADSSTSESISGGTTLHATLPVNAVRVVSHRPTVNPPATVSHE